MILEACNGLSHEPRVTIPTYDMQVAATACNSKVMEAGCIEVL